MQGTNRIILVVFLCLFAVQAAAQEPETNGYIADKPLSSYSHDIIKGNLIYTVGDSHYSEKLWSGDTYTVHHDITLPDGAVVKFARLYNYWTWSAEGTKGRYPDMKLTFDGVEPTPDRQYDDRKGWGMYDFPTGTWAYDVTGLVNESGTHTVVIENTGPSGSFFSINGVGLLVVYIDSGGKEIEYWVSEGCDMLNSQMKDDGTPMYFTTPDQTITEMMTPTIPEGKIKSATLWTVVQSGNWAADTLWVNDKKWTGLFEGKPISDLDVNVQDVTRYLKAGKNTVRFQAVGDYAVPSGSFLVVEMEPADKAASKPAVPENTARDASSAKSTSGFEAAYTIALVLLTASLTFRKSRKQST